MDSSGVRDGRRNICRELPRSHPDLSSVTVLIPPALKEAIQSRVAKLRITQEYYVLMALGLTSRLDNLNEGFWHNETKEIYDRASAAQYSRETYSLSIHIPSNAKELLKSLAESRKLSMNRYVVNALQFVEFVLDSSDIEPTDK